MANDYYIRNDGVIIKGDSAGVDNAFAGFDNKNWWNGIYSGAAPAGYHQDYMDTFADMALKTASAEGRPPHWSDVFNAWEKTAAGQGNPIDRTWLEDSGSQQQKWALDSAYMEAWKKYNDANPTAQVSPDATALGVRAQPNAYTPKPSNGGFFGSGIGALIKTAAIGALAYYGAGALVGAFSEGAVGLSAADTLGLTQMAADAGLTGDAAANFVASGGTLGSTAAAAVGTGLQVGENVDEFGNAIDMTGSVPATPAEVAAQTASAAPSVSDYLNKFVQDTFSPQNILKQGIKMGLNELTSSGSSGISAGTTRLSTGITPAVSTGGGSTTGGAASGGTLSTGAGIGPNGTGLLRLDGSNVFTQDGNLAIKGRGIIEDALQP